MVVSSGAHRGAPFAFGDPHFARRPYDPWAAYRQSKNAGVLLAVGALRWAGGGITANALHPGSILTRLRRRLDDDTMGAFAVMDGEGSLTPPPPARTRPGAAASALSAISPLLDGVTGRYFEDNQGRGSCAATRRAVPGAWPPMRSIRRRPPAPGRTPGPHSVARPDVGGHAEPWRGAHGEMRTLYRANAHIQCLH